MVFVCGNTLLIGPRRAVPPDLPNDCRATPNERSTYMMTPSNFQEAAMRLRLLLFATLCVMATVREGSAQIRLDRAFPALTFVRPVDMLQANDGTNRMYVVEQGGTIRSFDNNQSAASAQIFLDIRNKVRTEHNEEGLLGLAFPPNYRDSGYFYIYYNASNPRRSVVARYRRDASNPSRADSTSELVLLEVKKPFGNHNAGQIRFGPDGYLYIPLGDGGDAGDPFKNAQDLHTLLGKMLRINPTGTYNGHPYSIPSDNPFAGNTSDLREEIYAWGFRNPWRISFDPVTGWLWSSDAGQDAVEEINIVGKGKNYGWDILEGSGCFDPQMNCDSMARAMKLAMPIWDYTHRLGNVVIGGYVYRGSSMPGLAGRYIYADFTGRIWALRYRAQDTTAVENIELLNSPTTLITSFAVDSTNELYVLTIDGKILKLAGSMPARDSIAEPLKLAFPNLTFQRPVDMMPAPDSTNRLFVVEQGGTIRSFNRDASASSTNIFLDISSKVRTVDFEEGLLGLAFHPNYRSNGNFYVYYSASNPRRNVVARYHVDPSTPNRADSTSGVVLFEYEKPYGNHNGGQLRFGADGYLYISIGDGGNAGDPHRNAQDSSAVLGKILRIDVDNPSGGRQYGIPNDNPFAGNTKGYRPEIYALGLRNPWRFSFDRQTGWLWVGDAGQDKIEEVNVVRRGGNYGWNMLEGSGCFFPKLRCDSAARAMGMAMPIWDYTHNLGSAVVGGFVYRGSAMSNLVGRYIFGDFGSGRIWALSYDAQDTSAKEAIEIARTDKFIAAFGYDAQNEIYVIGLDGKIYTFQSNSLASARRDNPDAAYSTLRSAPNPTAGTTQLTYDLQKRGDVRLAIFDMKGRLVRTLAEGSFAGGAYAVTWEGADDRGTQVSSGDYICRLMVDGRTVASEKIVLVR
jgi:glucose/arabinose dehydrogenase